MKERVCVCPCEQPELSLFDSLISPLLGVIPG